MVKSIYKKDGKKNSFVISMTTTDVVNLIIDCLWNMF